jgi:plasmid stability protein
MSVSMTIRDVPDRTLEALAVRAARAGQSLEEYVRAWLTRLANEPDRTLFWDSVRSRVRATGTRLPASVILAARDADRR